MKHPFREKQQAAAVDMSANLPKWEHFHLEMSALENHPVKRITMYVLGGARVSCHPTDMRSP